MKTCIAFFFSTSDIKQSQIVRAIRHNGKRIVSREAFRVLDGKHSHGNFIHWNDQFQPETFLANEITFFWKLKTKKL